MSPDRDSDRSELCSTSEDESVDHTVPEQEVVVLDMRQQIVYSKLPWGIWALEKMGMCGCHVKLSYKLLTLVLTFCCYTSYHLSRKPTSVVKVAFCPTCAECNVTNVTGWAPFDSDNANALLGVLDYSWLFSYAIAMYFSGFLSERLNLRYFLTVGMIGSGISACLLGVAYFAEIHKLYYFILVQVFGGIMQSTGWPGVVAVMTHWFGKQNRGLVMGIWNSHTSVGNILGTIIPSFWADCDGDKDPWGWSFLVPGFIIIFVGILVYLFLVTDPTHIGVPPPVHHLKEDLDPKRSPHPQVHNANGDLSSYKTHSPAYGSNGYIFSSNSDSDGELINSEISKEQHNITGDKVKPINFFRALLIPGVIEYSMALFFNKLVSYTFLFWLPFYIKSTHAHLTGAQSDWLSTAFDVGGIIGGILAGVISDFLNARAITCFTMLILAIPMLFVMHSVPVTLWLFIVFLVINGILINGPYGMITTAVSSDLGTHPSLKANTNAKATVTAIIDGTGSVGAGVGPLLVGLITRYSDWTAVFYLLMGSCFVSALFMTRLVISEGITFYRNRIKNHNDIHLCDRPNGR